MPLGAPGTVGSGEVTPGEALLRVRQIRSEMEFSRDRAQLVVPKLLGVNEETARRITTEATCKLRVARRDRERYPLTLDHWPSRITVEIEDDKVVSAKVG